MALSLMPYPSQADALGGVARPHPLMSRSNLPAEEPVVLGVPREAGVRHSDVLSTLQRGLRVLEFVAGNEGVAPKEIAAALGLRLATTYHLVNTLLDEGYLVRVGLGGLVLGDRIPTLAENLDHRPTPFPELQPLLSELAERSGDVAVIGRLMGRQCVLMTVRSAPGAEHGDHLRAGMRGPAHTMALGKALVADLDSPEARAYLRTWPLEQLTERTVTTIDGMLGELETVRSRGFAVDVEEGEPGLCCIAARIACPPDRPAAAIAVAVSPERLRAEPERLTRLVVSAARRASALLASDQTRLDSQHLKSP